MKYQKTTSRFVRNQHVIDSEREGFGRALVQRHRTYIADPELRQKIRLMSHLEVIS